MGKREKLALFLLQHSGYVHDIPWSTSKGFHLYSFIKLFRIEALRQLFVNFIKWLPEEITGNPACILKC